MATENLKIEEPGEDRVAMGPFEVDPSGALFPRDGDAPPCFSFVWRNRSIEARLLGPVLHLVARVGRVPSSATRRPRPPAFNALHNLPRNLPAAWKIGIAASHAVQIEIAVPLQGRLTAASLMTAVTRQMLELAPYLDLFDELGVGATH